MPYVRPRTLQKNSVRPNAKGSITNRKKPAVASRNDVSDAKIVDRDVQANNDALNVLSNENALPDDGNDVLAVTIDDSLINGTSLEYTVVAGEPIQSPSQSASLLPYATHDTMYASSSSTNNRLASSDPIDTTLIELSMNAVMSLLGVLILSVLCAFGAIRCGQRYKNRRRIFRLANTIIDELQLAHPQSPSNHRAQWHNAAEQLWAVHTAASSDDSMLHNATLTNRVNHASQLIAAKCQQYVDILLRTPLVRKDSEANTLTHDSNNHTTHHPNGQSLLRKRRRSKSNTSSTLSGSSNTKDAGNGEYNDKKLEEDDVPNCDIVIDSSKITVLLTNPFFTHPGARTTVEECRKSLDALASDITSRLRDVASATSLTAAFLYTSSSKYSVATHIEHAAVGGRERSLESANRVLVFAQRYLPTSPNSDMARLIDAAKTVLSHAVKLHAMVCQIEDGIIRAENAQSRVLELEKVSRDAITNTNNRWHRQLNTQHELMREPNQQRISLASAPMLENGTSTHSRDHAPDDVLINSASTSTRGGIRSENDSNLIVPVSEFLNVSATSTSPQSNENEVLCRDCETAIADLERSIATANAFLRELSADATDVATCVARLFPNNTIRIAEGATHRLRFAVKEQLKAATERLQEASSTQQMLSTTTTTVQATTAHKWSLWKDQRTQATRYSPTTISTSLIAR